MPSGIDAPNSETRTDASASVANSRLVNTLPAGSASPSADDTDFRLLAESVPQIVWVRGRDGSLYFMNRRGLEYTGLSFAQMALSRSPAHAVHSDDREVFEKQWNESLEDRKSVV